MVKMMQSVQSLAYHNKNYQQEHLAAHKHEHIVHLHEDFLHQHDKPLQQGLKHVGFRTEHLGCHCGHLGLQQQFMQLRFEHCRHLGLLTLIVQHLLAQHTEVHFNLFRRARVGRIFLSRTSVVMFSISWTNLQRWRI